MTDLHSVSAYFENSFKSILSLKKSQGKKGSEAKHPNSSQLKHFVAENFSPPNVVIMQQEERNILKGYVTSASRSRGHPSVLENYIDSPASQRMSTYCGWKRTLGGTGMDKWEGGQLCFLVDSLGIEQKKSTNCMYL